MRASAASRSSALARLALAAQPRRPPPGGGGPLPPAPALEQRPGARLALLGGQRGQDDAGLGRRAARRASPAQRARPSRATERLHRWTGRRNGRRGRAGAPTGGASPGAKTRRFTFSTTTALLRPCEKLCRTVPCSTGRFRCSVVFGGGAPRSCRCCSSHSCLFLTAWPLSQFRGPAKRSGLIGRRAAALCPGCRVRFACAITAQTIRPREKGRTRRASLSAACITFALPNAKSNWREEKTLTRATASGLRAGLAREGLGSLGGPVRRAVAGLNERRDAARRDRRVDLERSRDDKAGFVGDRQRLQRVALQQRVDRLGEPAGASALARNARENACSPPPDSRSRSSAASTRRGRAVCGGYRAQPSLGAKREAQHRLGGVLPR